MRTGPALDVGKAMNMRLPACFNPSITNRIADRNRRWHMAHAGLCPAYGTQTSECGHPRGQANIGRLLTEWASHLRKGIYVQIWIVLASWRLTPRPRQERDGRRCLAGARERLRNPGRERRRASPPPYVTSRRPSDHLP